MIPLNIIRMTILFQTITNFILQFIRIVLKVLSNYLRDQTELFIDNVNIKKLKRTYNSQELATKIGCYMLEHI